MQAAGCCCCCSRAVQCAAGALGIAAAASCTSLDRGLEVCDRESILCRGRVGSRAFCDGGQLCIFWLVSDFGFERIRDLGGWLHLREEEEDEDCAEDDQAQDEPAGPIIPGTAVAYSLAIIVIITAGHCVSRVCGFAMVQVYFVGMMVIRLCGSTEQTSIQCIP
jgi:hypothetical protein